MISRERKCTFSLDFRSIGPSEFVGTRRKVVLRDEGNAWAPVLRSFNKIREVGVSSYLFYTLFKCFVMLSWFEAVRGRLIGPKTWDRIMGIYWSLVGQFSHCLGLLVL